MNLEAVYHPFTMNENTDSIYLKSEVEQIMIDVKHNHPLVQSVNWFHQKFNLFFHDSVSETERTQVVDDIIKRINEKIQKPNIDLKPYFVIHSTSIMKSEN